MLAKHLGIPHQAAKDGLRRAARKGLLQGGRVPEETPGEAGERAARADVAREEERRYWIAKSAFIRVEMRRTGCSVREAAERWEAS
jgi:hypothetical protein